VDGLHLVKARLAVDLGRVISYKTNQDIQDHSTQDQHTQHAQLRSDAHTSDATNAQSTRFTGTNTHDIYPPAPTRITFMTTILFTRMVGMGG
jgi:hypothetical protein